MTQKKAYRSSDVFTGRASMEIRRYLASPVFDRLVRDALAEDIGPGDLTAPVFAPGQKGSARFLAKEDGVISGLVAVKKVFGILDRRVRTRFLVKDGDRVHAGRDIGTVHGPLEILLLGERTALNFLQHFSGIATMTRRYVDALGDRAGQVGIYDTRKTTPLLRALEKKAVYDGGGCYHRFALYDMAMLKNNHIDAAGGIAEAVNRLKDAGFFRRHPRPGLCIECRNLDEAVEATWSGADIVLLDNMSPGAIRRAAEAIHREAKAVGRTAPQIEISGGITLKNLPKLKDLPIQRISVGAITHSAPGLDIAMHIE